MNATEQYDTLPYEPEASIQTPPENQAQPKNQAQPGEEQPRSERRHSWVGILATVIGSLVLIAIFGWTLMSGIWQGSIKLVDVETAVPAAENLRVDIGYGEVEINFSEAATEASLEVTGYSRGEEVPLTLTNAGSEIVLQTRNDNGWFDGGPGWWQDRELNGVLTLPASLEGKIDVNLSLGVGEVVVNGDLHNVQADVGAGTLYINNTFNIGEFSAGIGSIVLSEGGSSAVIEAGAGDVLALGTYDSLSVEVGIGSFSFEGTVKEKADFMFDMGDGSLFFDQSLPRETRIESNIANVTIEMPRVPIQLDAPYSVLASAEDAGYEIHGGEDAPRVLVLVDMGDVSFY